MGGHHIAQLNVARAVAPLDDSRMADFVNLLDEINRLAERSPGFVWRLQGPSGNATDLEVGDDPLVIVNLTVWESPDDLFAYTYRSDHRLVWLDVIADGARCPRGSDPKASDSSHHHH